MVAVEDLDEHLKAANTALGAAVTLVVERARLRWCVIGASSDIGRRGDPVRLDIGDEGPASPRPATRVGAAICRALGGTPSHVWWRALPFDRHLVVYWMARPGAGADLLSAAAEEIAERLPGETADDRAERAILLNVIDVLTVGLVYHDDDGRRVIANQAALDILELDQSGLTPRGAAEAMARLTEGATTRADQSILEIDREEGSFQVRSEPIQGAFGGGILWRIEDDTADRQRRLRLADAKRAALMADVAGGVGHEFNNLLARLICQAEAVQDAASPAAASAMAEEIIKTAEQGAMIVRRLMTYAGAARVDCQPVALAPLVAEWRGLADGRIRIEGDIAQASVVVDPDLLLASLDEIYDNAAKAGATRVTLRRGDDVAGFYALEIEDDGQGMTADDCLRASDPFFTRRAVGEGVGLGLSMVKGAMRQCGGELSIVSHPGKGTRVRLSMPLEPTRDGE